MIRIVLDGEQAKLVAHSEEMVEICDGDGRVPGRYQPAAFSDRVKVRR